MATKPSNKIPLRPIIVVGVLLLAGLILLQWISIVAMPKDTEATVVPKGELKLNSESDIQTISSPSIWDMYTYSGQAGHRIEIHVKPLSDTFVSICLYGDAELKNIIDQYPICEEAYGRGNEVIAHIVLRSTRTYYIIVNLSDDPGSYTIEITQAN